MGSNQSFKIFEKVGHLMHPNIYIYIYIYDIIQSSKFRIGNNSNQDKLKIFKNRILILNIPGKELNVNKIHRVNKIFFQKKNKKTTVTLG